MFFTFNFSTFYLIQLLHNVGTFFHCNYFTSYVIDCVLQIYSLHNKQIVEILNCHNISAYSFILNCSAAQKGCSSFRDAHTMARTIADQDLGRGTSLHAYPPNHPHIFNRRDIIRHQLIWLCDYYRTAHPATVRY